MVTPPQARQAAPVMCQADSVVRRWKRRPLREAGRSYYTAVVLANWRLPISGGGFRPGEQNRITVEANDTRVGRFTSTANAAGQFQFDTGLAVEPGSAVTLEAR